MRKRRRLDTRIELMLNPEQLIPASQRCPGKGKNCVMKYSLSVYLMLSLVSAAAEPPKSVEIRFCPASAVRTYPLESRRDLQSLLLQNIAVVNYGSAPFKIDNIDIALLQSNHVVESRKLDREAVQRIADRDAKLQAAGILQEVAFQFCGTDLIGSDIKVAGPILDRNRALLIVEQVFAFRWPRGTLRVRVHGNVGDRPTEFTGLIQSNLNLHRISTCFPCAVFGMWAMALRFIQVIAGVFQRSLRSILRSSVRVNSATKATERASMIIMLTPRMCLPRPMAV